MIINVSHRLPEEIPFNSLWLYSDVHPLILNEINYSKFSISPYRISNYEMVQNSNINWMWNTINFNASSSLNDDFGLRIPPMDILSIPNKIINIESVAFDGCSQIELNSNE